MVIYIQLRVELEGTRLLVLEAADHLDKFGNKKARGILAMAKVKKCYIFVNFLFLSKTDQSKS